MFPNMIQLMNIIQWMPLFRAILSLVEFSDKNCRLAARENAFPG
jgi:hypothetical protein